MLWTQVETTATAQVPGHAAPAVCRQECGSQPPRCCSNQTISACGPPAASTPSPGAPGRQLCAGRPGRDPGLPGQATRWRRLSAVACPQLPPLPLRALARLVAAGCRQVLLPPSAAQRVLPQCPGSGYWARACAAEQAAGRVGTSTGLQGIRPVRSINHSHSRGCTHPGAAFQTHLSASRPRCAPVISLPHLDILRRRGWCASGCGGARRPLHPHARRQQRGRPRVLHQHIIIHLDGEASCHGGRAAGSGGGQGSRHAAFLVRGRRQLCRLSAVGQTATVAPAATSCWACARADALEGAWAAAPWPPRVGPRCSRTAAGLRRGHNTAPGLPVELEGCWRGGGARLEGWARRPSGCAACPRAGCETRGRRCCKAWRSGDRCPGDPRLSGSPCTVSSRMGAPHTGPCRIRAPQFDGRQPASADTRPAGGVRHTEPRSGVPLCCEPRPGRLGRPSHRPGSDACSDWRGR